MADLGLKWFALPAVSGMRLEIGGVSFPAAPFSGWYVGSEIGARDLADIDRYNALPEIGQLLGLDTGSNRSLWKDRALIELNEAVLWSFAETGVAMVDHHTVTRQFLMHEKKRGESRTLCVCGLELDCSSNIWGYYSRLPPEVQRANSEAELLRSTEAVGGKQALSVLVKSGRLGPGPV